MDELAKERYDLAVERIREIREEKTVAEPYLDFFTKTAGFLEEMICLRNRVETGEMKKLSLEELRLENTGYYQDILPENYPTSYSSPDYAAKMLGEKYRLKVGLSGIIEGSLPIGGLSSSASVIICFLSALCKVNGIHLEPMEMILTAKAAENQYVGVACGKLDQSCEVLSKKNHLLYLDTKDDSYELIPTSEKMKPYKVAIFFSGLERSLKNSKYNLRQDECKAAAYALMGYAGMDYDTFANTRLRDVPYEVFEAYKDRLPELWRRRAEHYYSEFARAEKGAELWRKGDLEGYGQLVFESGKSSIYNYECGCDELKKLYEIMADTDGIYGGRFSGAGFKGCCMALIDPDKAEDIEAKVTAEYLKAFPALEGKYSFHLCESADGVEL